MIQSAREFFRNKRGHSFDSSLAPVEGTIRFDIEGAGSWRVKVSYGNLEIEESTAPADCVIRLSDPDLVDMVNGRRRAYTAFLQGRLVIEGDRVLAAGLTNFLRKAA